MPLRVLQDIAFAAWAQASAVSDQSLCKAAREVDDGLIDARLGGFLLKKRIAAPGKGKRGGYRTIIGYRQRDRLVFLYGFAKNEMENITRKEREALRMLGDIYLQASSELLERMVLTGQLKELQCHE